MPGKTWCHFAFYTINVTQSYVCFIVIVRILYHCLRVRPRHNSGENRRNCDRAFILKFKSDKAHYVKYEPSPSFRPYTTLMNPWNAWAPGIHIKLSELFPVVWGYDPDTISERIGGIVIEHVTMHHARLGTWLLVRLCQGGYFKPHVLLELSKAQPAQFRRDGGIVIEHPRHRHPIQVS